MFTDAQIDAAIAEDSKPGRGDPRERMEAILHAADEAARQGMETAPMDGTEIDADHWVEGVAVVFWTTANDRTGENHQIDRVPRWLTIDGIDLLDEYGEGPERWRPRPVGKAAAARVSISHKPE